MAPRAKGKTYAAVIAEALVTLARKGDVRAISETGKSNRGQACAIPAGWLRRPIERTDRRAASAANPGTGRAAGAEASGESRYVVPAPEPPNGEFRESDLKFQSRPEKRWKTIDRRRNQYAFPVSTLAAIATWQDCECNG